MDIASPEFMLLIVIALIALSGFFSSSETALMAINRYRLKHLIKEDHSAAKRVEKLLKRPDRLIGLILIGNNLVNFAAASIVASVVGELYGTTLANAIATIVLTFVVLVFAEIGPKTVAAYHPEKVAFPASTILLPLLTALKHVVIFINKFAQLVVRPLGINPNSHKEKVLSNEELRTMVLEARNSSSDNKASMMVNILDLNKADVDEILVRRNDIVGIDLNASEEDIQKIIVSSNYTRLPVYEDDINNILGVFHMRNTAKIMNQSKLDIHGIRLLMKDPYFIQENTALTTQLTEFQKAKERMAIVVDEYGDIMGLVTLEDILEEIVGDFTSDVADNNKTIVKQEDCSYVIEGATTLRDINKTLKWDLHSDDAITLNGLLLEHLETFPQAQTSLKINDYRFEIVSIGDNRIESVNAIKLTS